MPLASSIPPSLSATSSRSSVTPRGQSVDVYFSADIETDGPIPGPYSMLAVGVALAGTFDGEHFVRPPEPVTFYRELRPISDQFQAEALRINGLDRQSLVAHGAHPEFVMRELAEWIRVNSGAGEPVLVAYPLSFDWTWLYWYFINFGKASPFNHSRCFDIKTAFAVKARIPVAGAGRARLPPELIPDMPHTHNALDDALEQAEIFARVFEWNGHDDRDDKKA